jgi:hypothetical protein
LVDAIAQIHIEGDITPRSWYKHICYQTSKSQQKKTDRLAIDILSDIVYWYRPSQIREEITGEFLGWKQKFVGNILRRSPEAFAEALNATVRCVRESMRLLENLGLIKVILSPVRTQYGTIPNVMHIEVVPEAIKQITYRSSEQKPETLEKALLTKWVTKSDETRDEARRNEEVPATKCVAPANEIVDSSIYRDLYRDLTETFVEKAGENPTPSENQKNSGRVDEEADLPPKNSPSSALTTKISHVEPNSSLGGIAALAQVEPVTTLTFDPKMEKLASQIDSGELKDLPSAEKKQLANYMMGEQVKAYRSSGWILSPRPNDINVDFLKYVAWKELKQPNNLEYARNTINSYERNMTKWGQLVALVQGWQTVTPEEVAATAIARVDARQGSKEDLQIAIKASLDAYKTVKNPFKRKVTT